MIDLAHTPTGQFVEKVATIWLIYILSREVDLVIVIRKRDFRNIIRSEFRLNNATYIPGYRHIIASSSRSAHPVFPRSAS
jgi:hypothetical protein